MKCNQRTSTIYTEKYLLFRIADSCTQHCGCNNLNNDGARPVNTDLVQYASQCLRYAALHVPQLFDKLTPVETVPTEHVTSHRFISLRPLCLSLSLWLYFYIYAAHIEREYLSFFFFLQSSNIVKFYIRFTILNYPKNNITFNIILYYPSNS